MSKDIIRKGSVFFLCIFLTIFFSGCGKSPQEKRQEKRVEIRLATFAVGWDLDIWKKGINLFEEKYPHIKVQLIVADWSSYWTKVQIMFASGTAPDVMFSNTNYFEGFCRRNAYLDLKPFIERDKEEIDLDDFNPVMLQAFSDHGRIYALPTDNAVELIFYNKDIFDKENYPYPEEGWTWDDLLNTATALTKDTDGDGKIDQFGYQIDLNSYINWVQQNKGRLFTEDGKECLFTSPEVIEALKFMFVPVRQHACPSYLESKSLEAMGGSVMGHVAMAYSGCWHIPMWQQQAKFNWDVAPLPKGRVRANRTGGSGYAMFAKTKHPEEAWLLIKTLTSKEVLKILGESGRIPPARKSVLSSLIVPGKPLLHAQQVIIDELKYAHIPYLFPVKIRNWVEVESIIYSELEKVYIGESTVESACERIKKRVDSIIRE